MKSDLIKLLDIDFYRETTQTNWESAEEALEHQLATGWREGHDPNPWFSNKYYLNRYPDVASADVPPLLHFAEHGYKEGRDPSDRFSTSKYRTKEMHKSPDVNPLVHFLEHHRSQPGSVSARALACSETNVDRDVGSPSPGSHSKVGQLDGQFGRAVRVLPAEHESTLQELLDVDWYAKTYELDPADAVDHYLNTGRFNLFAPSRHFNALNYIRENYDVYLGDLDPALHYALHGISEGRAGFSTSSSQERGRSHITREGMSVVVDAFKLDLEWYLDLYPELRAPLMDAVLHFRLFGEAEGRSGSRYFDAKYYKQYYSLQLDGWKGSALEHFLAVGLLNGARPSAAVAAAMNRSGHRTAAEWYLTHAGMDAHILRRGVRESKKLAPTLDIPALDPIKTNSPSPNRVGDYRRTVNWVIPKFSKGAGGHTTIFRCARTLARLGWAQVFWIYDEPNPVEALRLRTEYCAYFPSTPCDLRVVNAHFYAIRGEFVVATAWESCRHVNALREGNVGLYFVQDFEPMFLPAGERALKAEWTYQLGLDCICAGDWLLGKVGAMAPKAMAFSLAAERGFKNADLSFSQRHYDLCLYLRGHTERRCSELLSKMLVELANTAELRVCVFGDDAFMPTLPESVEQLGIISPKQMAEVFSRSRIGIAASATNYSIVPVEMAASGMLVVEPSSSSTLETTRSHGVMALPPDAKVLAHEIARMLQGFDDSSFAEATSESRSWAQGLDWETEFERVSDFLSGYFEGPLKAAVVPSRVAPSVTVAIPTYYPGNQILEVVAAVRRQLTSVRALDILIVDSVKNGEKDSALSLLPPGPDLKIHEIDARDFQHGDTRNLAASLTESDVIVFLTQDAIPVDEYWLESLIAPFQLFPSVAISYGRHAAYPVHNRLYGIELDQMFDGIASRGPLARASVDDTRFAEDVYFRAGLCFNSDNNSAYKGEVLRRMKFPSVPFAEDQAFSAMALEAGYASFFASTAVVRHSHDYTDDLASARARGFEEGQAFKQNFNTYRLKTPQQRTQEKLFAAKWAIDAGIKHGCNRAEINAFISAKHSYIDGIWDYCAQFVDNDGD